jgi:flagellar hook assembly protein FlgD
VERSEQSRPGSRAGAWLLVGLLIFSVAGFAVTRVLRAADDVVNTVELDAEIVPGGPPAELRFSTTLDEPRADVLIIDASEQRVRALQEAELLPAGEHRFEWDGRDDAGSLVPAGLYGFRVVLDREDRDIVPPGKIEVRSTSAGGAP